MALPSEDLEDSAPPTEKQVGERASPSNRRIVGGVPVHPISQLQGPFEESMREALEGVKEEWVVNFDAQSRRKDLLESQEYTRLCGRRWRQRNGERYHPFWKLAAQMSFGINLLINELAKSNVEVLKILQCHVDEVDGFLGRTTEDLLIIQIDVRTRIQYLSLPLENLDVFDEMLGDRSFRLAMIDYNEKIEHAISRFSIAVDDTLKDLQKGREAIGALWQYLRQSAVESAPLSSHLAAVYDSMLANTEGWNMAFSKLQKRGVALQSALSQLGLAITEMQRRVGVASRKDVVSFLQYSTNPQRGLSLRQRIFEKGLSITSSSSSEKPLPRDPSLSSLSDASPLPRTRDLRRMAQKSVPNMRLTGSAGCHNERLASSQAGSSNEASGSPSPVPLVPKFHQSLSKRLSKARLATKRSMADLRPATAPTRTAKSQSMQEGLTGSQKAPNHRHVMSPAFSQPDRPVTSERAKKHDTMKTQLLQYIKSDRVIDAWESTTQKQKLVRRLSQRKKDGPRSKFRVKSSNTPRTPADLQTKLFEEDLDNQMAWLQEESEALNTYSLKPKCDVAPRIHVLSVHMTLTREQEGGESRVAATDDTTPQTKEEDSQSIITALPSI